MIYQSLLKVESNKGVLLEIWRSVVKRLKDKESSYDDNERKSAFQTIAIELNKQSKQTNKQQEFGDDLSVCVLNIFPKVNSLLSLLAINLVEEEVKIFQTVVWPQVGYLIKGSCLGASYTKSPPCPVWYRCSTWRWRYVFYLSLNHTRPLRPDVMNIYGWELLAACHYPKKFGDHRHSYS